MIAALALSAADGEVDLDRLRAAAAACDRATVSRAWAEETKRHGDFVVAGLREQAAIAADRQALDARRRAARAAGGLAGLAGLTAEGADIDDRQRALDDRRRLDVMQQEAVVYFRGAYLTGCNGRER